MITATPTSTCDLCLTPGPVRKCRERARPVRVCGRCAHRYDADGQVRRPDALFPVAALYVDPAGPYPHLVADGHWYDMERDARTYTGNLPIVAHPPCGPWGKLATTWHALDLVRRNGGILEHPVGSRLFKEAGIPTAPWTPDRLLDAYGGYTIKVPQWDLGHRGMKDTIFYIVGTSILPPLFQRQGGTPHPVQERRLTPTAMAWWMCQVAASVWEE